MLNSEEEYNKEGKWCIKKSRKTEGIEQKHEGQGT
jgi:hypothetical protein